MYYLITKNDLLYWVRDDQVEQVQQVLNSGVKWLKLGNDLINTAHIVSLVKVEARQNSISSNYI